MTAPPGRSLWRDRDFVLLWTANTTSQLGTRVAGIAVPLFAVDTLAASTWNVGLLSAVQNLGIVLVGLPAGAWVDRLRRRRLMLAMDLSRAVMLGTVAVAALAGYLSLHLLFLVAVGTGVSTAVFDIAHQTYLPSLVGADRVVRANANLQTSQSIAVASGPGLGGALVSWLGGASAMIAPGLTYLASFGALRLIGRSEQPPEPRADRRLAAEIAEGLRFVLTDRVLRAIALCTATTNLFMSMVFGLVVLFLSRTVGLAPVSIGLILAASGLAGVVAALTVSRWTAAQGPGRTIWLSLLLTQPFALLLPWAAPDLRLGLFLIGWLVLGYGATLYNIVQVSYRQLHCPGHLLGRVQASNRFFAWGTLPVGGLAAGALGTWLGVREALLIAAVGLVGSTTWLTASPLRSESRPARQTGTFVSDRDRPAHGV